MDVFSRVFMYIELYKYSFLKPNIHWFSIMPNSVCLWRKCYFFFDMKLCLLKIAIRREKFDKKVSESGAVWETEIRSTIGLIFSDVTGCTQRARGRVCCIVFRYNWSRWNFHFKKNGGKYYRTEFSSGCIRRRWRKGQELFFRQRQWWRRFGRFWLRSWWKSSAPMPMACLSVTAASPTA